MTPEHVIRRAHVTDLKLTGEYVLFERGERKLWIERDLIVKAAAMALEAEAGRPKPRPVTESTEKNPWRWPVAIVLTLLFAGAVVWALDFTIKSVLAR